MSPNIKFGSNTENVNTNPRQNKKPSPMSYLKCRLHLHKARDCAPRLAVGNDFVLRLAAIRV
jgi:hypothetical protein